jgi:hypothetical protein
MSPARQACLTHGVHPLHTYIHTYLCLVRRRARPGQARRLFSLFFLSFSLSLAPAAAAADRAACIRRWAAAVARDPHRSISLWSRAHGTDLMQPTETHGWLPYLLPSTFSRTSTEDSHDASIFSVCMLKYMCLSTIFCSTSILLPAAEEQASLLSPLPLVERSAKLL